MRSLVILFYLSPAFALFGLYCVLAWIQPVWIDSGVYLYIAQGVLDGEVPYLDSWDHKGPLIYLFDAFGIRFLGDPAGIYLLEGGLVALSLALFLTSWRQILDAKTTFVVGVMFLLSYFAVFGLGNQSETWQLPFTLFAYSALARWLLARNDPADEAPSTGGTAFAIGFAGGIAAALRFNNGIGLAVAACILVVAAGRARYAALLWVIAGGLSVVIPILIYIVSSGAWEAMYTQYLEYNFSYIGGAGVDNRFDALQTLPRWLMPVLLVYALPVVLVRFLSADRHRLPGALMMFLPIFMADTAGAFIPGRGYSHYLVLLLPSLTVAAALGLVGIRLPSWQWSVKIVATAGLALLVLVPVLLLVKSEFSRAYALGLANPDSRAVVIVDYIENNSAPGDPVLVYGWSPAHIALANRRTPTTNSYLTPFLNPNFDSTMLIESFLSQIQQHPPKLIVRETRTCPFAVTDCPAPDPYTVPESGRLGDVRAWILDHYEIAEQYKGAEIWVKRADDHARNSTTVLPASASR